MKLYVDNRKNPNGVELGYTLYSNKGVILAKGVQIVNSKQERHAFTIKSMIQAVTRLKQLHDNGKLTMDKVTIFTRNTVMYNWFQVGTVPKNYKDLFDDVLHQLDWLPFEVELVLTKNVTNKVKYESDIPEEKGYTMAELMLEEIDTELKQL